MDEKQKKRLAKKGWNDEEISKADDILKTKSEKHQHVKRKLNVIAYWILIIVLIKGNIFAAFYISPLLVLLKPPIMYFLIVLISIALGIFLNHVLLEIEHLDKKHHVMFLLLIPLLGIIDALLMSFIFKKFNMHLTGYNVHLLVLLFVFGFIIPYFVYSVMGKHKV